jgi:hypothetical protein
VSIFKSTTSSFDRQFLDIFSSLARSRDEVEKTVAAVSLLYVQDVKHITTELRDTGIIQRKSRLMMPRICCSVSTNVWKMSNAREL